MELKVSSRECCRTDRTDYDCNSGSWILVPGTETLAL